MTAVNWGQRAINVDLEDLRQMIGPDEHRPGPMRARLLAEQIPVWAIIGHAGAVAGTSGPTAITEEVLAQVAADYDISTEAVHAALLYYHEHQAAIDTLLETNAATLT